MTELAERLEKIPELLVERVARYRVPGASLAVLCDGQSFETAAGVVNRDTGVETTPDAVFQIGSITKVFTTTLIMQLAEEGRVELDEPVRTYLPELQLGDHEAARSVTLRHLLTHSSGIDGDFFQDTGRGDDCVERYVLACSGLGQLHRPGELFSYCNSGFAIAGRIVEKLRGMTWDAALRHYVLDPIGAESMHTLPEQALYYRAAVGHVLNPESGDFKVASRPFLARSNGPAGATPFAAARDLLQFARMHLSGGVAEGGARVLSEASVQKMQEPQIATPEAHFASGWGLGWALHDWGGERVIGHDGGTIGHNSYFRVLPERGIAVALLTNGGNTAALYRRIFDGVLGPLAGVSLPLLAENRELELDPNRYLGTYERLATRLIVEEGNGKLMLTSIERRPLLEEGEQMTVELSPVTESTFSWLVPGTSFRNYLTFLEFGEDGRAGYLHSGGRSAPRVR